MNISKLDQNLSIFSITLDNYQELNQQLKEVIEEHRKLYPETNNSNVKAWHSNWESHKDNPKFKLIVDKVLELCEVVSLEYFNRKIQFECSNMWAIQYEKGEYAVKHSHYPSDFACVYYVDVEPGCSPIIFEEELEVFPQNGMLLIFPANLQHEVPPTDSKRIVISMNVDRIGSRNMDVVKMDDNVSVKPISVPNSEGDQKVFLDQQLQEFLNNDLSSILNSYNKNVEEDLADSGEILEIYNIIESYDINLTEESIFNFLQIEHRWPYQYFKDTENPRQGPSSIYGFETPIQVIVKENVVERNSFYDRTGKFIFNEWKKYYDLGFTTMISNVLDLTPELRKLRSEIFNITGINVEGNFYFTNGGKKVHSSWLPHKHHYNVIVKMIYGDTKWKISDDIINYSEGDTILIPSETYHSVVECPNKRLSLTINLF
jgi:hypothetical protein